MLCLDCDAGWWPAVKPAKAMTVRPTPVAHTIGDAIGEAFRKLQDMDIEDNPYEVRLGWQVDLEKDDFIGKDALAKIKEKGVDQRLVGLRLGGEPIIWYNEDFYLVKDNDTGENTGYVTSAFWSPTQESNIALAVMPRSHWKRGTKVKVALPNDGLVDAEVVRVPFTDPTKETPKTELSAS